MKKVLFIIQSYPSNHSANVLCDEKIMKAMIETGEYEIHCLAYRFHGQPLYEEMNGFKVHRFKRSKWWNLFTYAQDNENKWQCRLIVKLDRVYMRLKQVLCIPLYPNYEPLLARMVAKEAVKLHSKEKFDMVVAEHHGRDTLYGGYRLKKFDPQVKFVSILWDPMSGKTLAKYVPASYAHKRLLADERNLLSNSDRIICLDSNRGYQETHSVGKPFYRNIRFLGIPGIVPPANERMQESFTVKNRINILYSGILTIPDRDPSAIISILNESRYASRFNIMFFSTGLDGIAKTKRALKDFKGTFLIHPYVEKRLLDSIAANSQILLNLGGPNPNMVPSKIYEYVSLGKPIISTYYIDDESSKQRLGNYPSALCLDTRKPIQESVKSLDIFIEKKLNTLVDFSIVRDLFPINTPQAFLDVFGEIPD